LSENGERLEREHHRIKRELKRTGRECERIAGKLIENEIERRDNFVRMRED